MSSLSILNEYVVSYGVSSNHHVLRSIVVVYIEFESEKKNGTLSTPGSGYLYSTKPENGGLRDKGQGKEKRKKTASKEIAFLHTLFYLIFFAYLSDSCYYTYYFYHLFTHHIFLEYFF
jgi:hypothetical protein